MKFCSQFISRYWSWEATIHCIDIKLLTLVSLRPKKKELCEKRARAIYKRAAAAPVSEKKKNMAFMTFMPLLFNRPYYIEIIKHTRQPCIFRFTRSRSVAIVKMRAEKLNTIWVIFLPPFSFLPSFGSLEKKEQIRILGVFTVHRIINFNWKVDLRSWSDWSLSVSQFPIETAYTWRWQSNTKFETTSTHYFTTDNDHNDDFYDYYLLHLAKKAAAVISLISYRYCDGTCLSRLIRLWFINCNQMWWIFVGTTIQFQNRWSEINLSVWWCRRGRASLFPLYFGRTTTENDMKLFVANHFSVWKKNILEQNHLSCDILNECHL